MHTKFKNSIICMALSTLLVNCGVNKAKQKEAGKTSFDINEQQVQSLLKREYNDLLSGLTVFFLPNSDGKSGETQIHRDNKELEIDIHNADKDVVAEKRKIAKILVEVPLKIDYHANIAKAAGAHLLSEKTQCKNLLTAVQGMQICEEKMPEIEAGLAQLTTMKAQMEQNLAQAEAKRAHLIAASEQTVDNSGIQIEDNSGTPQVEINYSAEIAKLDQTIAAIKNGLATQIEPKLAEVQGNADQCAALPGLFQSLTPFHENIPTCVKKKQELDTHKAKAEELGMQIVMAVGPTNWIKTAADKSFLKFKKEQTEMTLSFGENKEKEQLKYSTEDNTITDITWDEEIRTLKFHIHEKDQDGNLTGFILFASLEQSATATSQTFSGSIKKYEDNDNSKHENLLVEGKLNITQDIKVSQQ